MVQESTTTPQRDNWTVFKAYEAGKSRRYGLLFTINGGAFALIGFLVSNNGQLLTISQGLGHRLIAIWAFFIMPLALGAFSYFACEDIKRFAKNMRCFDVVKANDREMEEKLKIYGPEGARYLNRVQGLLVGAWLAAILFLFIPQWLP
jgi:hypothetical protein